MTEKESEWAERVSAWRASGETAEQFADRHGGYSGGTLRWWSSQLKRRALAPKPGTLARVEVRSRSSLPSGVRLEVAGARIEVDAGFDADLLRAVVAALAPKDGR